MSIFVKVCCLDQIQAMTVSISHPAPHREVLRVDDMASPVFTRLLLGALSHFHTTREYAEDGNSYTETYVFDAPTPNDFSQPVKIVGHPIKHPNPPNTQQWIVEGLTDLIETNKRHYDPRIAKLIGEIEASLQSYLASL